ncbi:Ig-like domain-containing protein [Sphingobium sp. CR2-8]|nr:Ig-like domain-containing protein [Sphingobium sp. CR2-8]MEC3910172.1 Ig-like domain-containing protein [Sphingobium sp. CR2-8]
MNAQGSVCSGTAEANATVEIRDVDGNLIGSGTAEADGSYAIALAEPLTNGETVRVTQIDAAGNVSPPTLAFAPDFTAPQAPTAVLDTLSSVVGTGEAGATVTVKNAAGTVLGTGQVGSDGSYIVSLSTPQNDGETLSVTQTDAAGNGSQPAYLTAPDGTAPDAPVATIADDGLTVTGTGEAGATVRIYDEGGLLIGTTTVQGDGTYSATLDVAQTNGQALTATQADAAGNLSLPASLTAPDSDAPAMPGASISPDGSIVTGSGEAGAVVEVRDTQGLVIGSDVVRPDGSYTVTLTPALIDGEALTVIQVDPAGNPSLPTPITAPDLTPPAAPSATIASDGATISGRGEVGATVTVTDAAGTPIGTAQVDANGDYLVELDTPLIDGEVVSVIQSDTAGNPSLGTSVTAPDYTPPPSPTAMIDGTGSVVTGSVVSGTGVAGSMIEVRAADGTVLGTGVVDAQGNFTVRLDTPQVDGEPLGVVQLDQVGNPSVPTPIIAPDLTPPAAPSATITLDGATISGRGEVGATVTVTDAAGTPIGTAQVDANGDYLVELDTPLIDGEVVSVIQSDAAGNPSLGTSVTAPDYTPPPSPTAMIDGTGSVVTGSVVSGTGVAGSTIEVRAADGTVLGTGVVDAQGNFTVRLDTPQVDGEPLGVVQLDQVGNPSLPTPITAPDLTPPAAPSATITLDGATISGRGEVGATVTVTDATGTPIGTAQVDVNGDYLVTLDTPLINGEVVSVIQSDAAGNPSLGTSVTAPDYTPPPSPTAMIDGTGSVVTGSVVSGTGVAGSVIEVRAADGTVLGTGVVDAQGNFTVRLDTPQVDGEPLGVVQLDQVGNPSVPTPITAPDLTPPAAPSATITLDGATISGRGEVGATVTVTDAAGTPIGTAQVDVNGDYLVTLDTPLIDGEVVSVIQSDAAGNPSPSVSVTAPDYTAPPVPTADIDDAGRVVTGTGVAGSIIAVRATDGTPLGSAIVNARGNYTVTLSPPQINSEPLTVTQSDGVNVSGPTNITAPDLTPPDVPFATVAPDGASISGTGEPGATVTITDPTGFEIGTATVGEDSTWQTTLVPPQTHGEPLGVIQSDGAGNDSPQLQVNAPNLNGPDAPDPVTATVSGNGETVTGTGEIGATVSIRGPGGLLLGTAIVDGNGDYSVDLNPPQRNGETLVAVQTDVDGFSSVPVLVIAPDITAPGIPIAQIDQTGAVVTGSGSGARR